VENPVILTVYVHVAVAHNEGVMNNTETPVYEWSKIVAAVNDPKGLFQVLKAPFQVSKLIRMTVYRHGMGDCTMNGISSREGTLHGFTDASAALDFAMRNPRYAASRVPVRQGRTRSLANGRRKYRDRVSRDKLRQRAGGVPRALVFDHGPH
jgi:hypothetical protein